MAETMYWEKYTFIIAIIFEIFANPNGGYLV